MIPFQSQTYTLGANGIATVNIQGNAIAYQSGNTQVLTFRSPNGSFFVLGSGQGVAQTVHISQLQGLPGDSVTIGFGDALPVSLGVPLAGGVPSLSAGSALPPQRALFASSFDVQLTAANYNAADLPFLLLSAQLPPPANNTPLTLALRRLRLYFIQNSATPTIPPVVRMFKGTGAGNLLANLVQATPFDNKNPARFGALAVFPVPSLTIPAGSILGSFPVPAMSSVAGSPQDMTGLELDFSPAQWDQSLIVRTDAGNPAANTGNWFLTFDAALPGTYRAVGMVEWAEYWPGQSN